MEYPRSIAERIHMRRHSEACSRLYNNSQGSLITKERPRPCSRRKLMKKVTPSNKKVQGLLEQNAKLSSQISFLTSQLHQNNHMFDNTLGKYTEFLIQKLKEAPQLYRTISERVNSPYTFLASLEDPGKAQKNLLVCVGILCDLLVCELSSTPEKSPDLMDIITNQSNRLQKLNEQIADAMPTSFSTPINRDQGDLCLKWHN